MPLFRNVTAVALVMQFGHDLPIEIEPGEVAEVPERWEGLVKARGYQVERVDGEFGEFVEMAKSLTAPLVPDLTERFESLLAFIRSAPSREELDKIFAESKDLESMLSEEQVKAAHDAAMHRCYGENFGKAKPDAPPVGVEGGSQSPPIEGESKELETDTKELETKDGEGSADPKKPRSSRKKPDAPPAG